VLLATLKFKPLFRMACLSEPHLRKCLISSRHSSTSNVIQAKQ